MGVPGKPSILSEGMFKLEKQRACTRNQLNWTCGSSERRNVNQHHFVEGLSKSELTLENKRHSWIIWGCIDGGTGLRP